MATDALVLEVEGEASTNLKKYATQTSFADGSGGIRITFKVWPSNVRNPAPLRFTITTHTHLTLVPLTHLRTCHTMSPPTRRKGPVPTC